MENRNFDKFYADVYGWILFQAQNKPDKNAKWLLEETPNASFEEKDSVLEFRFNLLTVKEPDSSVESLDEFQDYVLECIQKNPDWTGTNRDVFYSEMYVQAWISAIKNVLHLLCRRSSRYAILEKFCGIIENSGFTSNLNSHAG